LDPTLEHIEETDHANPWLEAKRKEEMTRTKGDGKTMDEIMS
jgi:hypothetical protein